MRPTHCPAPYLSIAPRTACRTWSDTSSDSRPAGTAASRARLPSRFLVERVHITVAGGHEHEAAAGDERSAVVVAVAQAFGQRNALEQRIVSDRRRAFA